MKSEYRLFSIVAAFLFLASVVYAWWTNHETDSVEMIGVIALALSGLLTLMCSGYFWFVARRIDPRPEDRADADIADGAGEIGFFSPGSYYPFGLGLAVVLTGVGLVYFLWWLIIAGIVAVLFTTGGLLFEYYTGARKAH